MILISMCHSLFPHGSLAPLALPFFCRHSTHPMCAHRRIEPTLSLWGIRVQACVRALLYGLGFVNIFSSVLLSIIIRKSYRRLKF
jgi:hypothetical protein